MAGESENDGDHAGTGEDPGQLCLGVIAIAQDQKKRDEENESANDFTQKMRDRRLLSLFEIEIPYVTIDQSDNECSAQENR